MQDDFHESPLYPFLVSQIRTPAIHFIIYGQLTKTLLRLTQKAQNRQMGSGQGVDIGVSLNARATLGIVIF
jgi:hypothetical protein